MQSLAIWLEEDDRDSTYPSTAASSSSQYYYGDGPTIVPPPPPPPPPGPASLPGGFHFVPKPTFSSMECRKELLRLSSLRNCLAESLLTFKDANENFALRDCQDYHATLLAFEKQGFPSVEKHALGVDEQYQEFPIPPAQQQIQLTWRDAFCLEQQETHHSLSWERAGCLWNVIALQSHEAATNCDLTQKDECKTAISLLQSSASLLSTLKELVGPQEYATVDYSSAMLHFWQIMFKAQGQFVIYKMANSTDGTRQHSTLAYLVQAAASLYNEALDAAKDPRLQSEVTERSKLWATHCKAQSLICQARATFHMSIDHRIQQEHGTEIARLSQCVQQLKETHDFMTMAGIDRTEIQGLVQLARDRLERARSDNDALYVDPIPNHLSDIRAQFLVKSDVPLPAAMLQPKVPVFEWVKRK